MKLESLVMRSLGFKEEEVGRSEGLKVGVTIAGAMKKS